MAINSASYDPAATAQALAEAYIMPRQQILDNQSKLASATEKALTELNSAMLSFQSSLSAMTGINKTLFAQSATFSDTSIGSATAGSTAAAGTYSFFVKQLATASQVSYTGLTDNAGVGGTLNINMGGALAFNVNLGAADTDANGTLSTRELAAAINGASGNTSKVTASIITTGSTSELVLTAKGTGAATAITIDTSGVTGASSLADANADPLRRRTLVAAQDAEIRVGSETGTPIIQATNSFTNIDGVTMNFTKAQAPGAAPVTITVGANTSGTQANVQAFIDAFNKLKTTLNKLTAAGDASKGADNGTFAHDGGIRALSQRLNSLLRPLGADSLAAYGILAAKDGTLELNTTRLQSQLAKNPTGLDTLIGKATAGSPTGIAGSLDTYLKTWSNSLNGQIKLRKDATSNVQKTVTDRQGQLDKQYEAAYQRYLTQFTQLQSMQGVMNQNASMFDAMFSNSND